MKITILGLLLATFSFGANAGYMYAYKDDSGKAVLTSDQYVMDKHEAKRKAENQAILDERRKQARELASKPPVAIGMSTEQVRNKTNWGEPKYVNTTVSKYGTHEQWVYGDYQYLYFEDGKLSTIQQ